MSAEIFDMKIYKKALKLAKKGKSLNIKPQSNISYENEKKGKKMRVYLINILKGELV